MMDQMQDIKFCQCYYQDLTSMTLPDTRKALRLKKIWWKWKRYAWYFRVLGPINFLNKMSSSGPSKSASDKVSIKSSEALDSEGPLNLEPGELVEVRSVKEIFSTLDRDGELKGLRFTPEMSKYCGKKVRVYKRIKKIIIETTGEMRSMKSPTVLLEGVICDGSAHSGCERTCFLFWREEWLKKVAPESQ